MSANTAAPAELVVALRLALAEVTATPPAELLRLEEVLALTGQGKTSWYRAVSGGEAPAACRTPSGPRWRRADILKWIDRLKS